MTVQGNSPVGPRRPRPDEAQKTAPAAPAAPAAPTAPASPASLLKSVTDRVAAAATTFTNAVERTVDGGVKVDLHEAAVAARELRSARRAGAAAPAAPAAPAAAPAAAGTPVTNLAGIELRGLDLNSIQEGTFKMTVPMREGTFKMPTSYEDAEIGVPRNTKAEVTVKVEKGPDGKPRIADVSLQFNNKLTVLNPASSLQPNSGTFGKVIDKVEDWLGDINIKGLNIDKTGQIKVDGVVDKPWPLSDSKLQDELSPGTFPKLNMDLQSIVSGQAVAKPADPAKIQGKQVGLDQMLRGLGAMTKLGNYSIDLKSGPSRLQADAKGIHLSTDEAPVQVHVEGKVNVEPDGAITLAVDKNAAPELTSGAGKVDIDGQMRLQADSKGSFSGTGDVSFRANVDGLSAKVPAGGKVSVPVEIRGADNVVAGNTSITLNGSQVQFKNGSASMNINTRLPEGTRVDVSGTGVSLKDGQLHTDAGLKFDYDGKAIHVSDGTVNANVTASDADMLYNGVKVRVDGKTDIAVHGEQIRLDSTTMSPSGVGKITMSATPKPGSLLANPALPPLKAEADFKLTEDGKLSLKPGQNGFTELIAPFTGVTGRPPKNMVAPTSPPPPAGPVGSQALKDQVAQLTGSKVEQNNHVELLIDGVNSLPKRLELIKNAKDSICLQTLIFKDDKSGMETAQALIDAAKRGVKVKVVVDALGNCENLKDLTEGKKVYDMLRQGGVELQLYNDPKQTGLKEIIDEVKKHPELAEIKGANDLSDPAKAMALFQTLAKISKGEKAAPADSRKRITSALGKLLTATPGQPPTISLNEIAKLAAGDTSRATELMSAAKTMADLNGRWHEKYLVVDGKSAIMGGMNIADEYLLGGTGAKIESLGTERPAWRDTDMLIQGPAAADAYHSFARNWKTVTGQDMPPPPPADSLAIDKEHGGGTEVQILQHRPRQDGDHNIENFFIENVKALKPGEKCYIANAYFLPTGALESYKNALMDAAKRGVDVRILTNSQGTSDGPQINQAATESYREMLAAGVRIFERTGDRTMHQKVAVFGDNTVGVGSFNADNRSSSLNSEALAVVYGEQTAHQLQDQLVKDMAPDVAKEVKPSDVKSLSVKEELKRAAVSLFSDLM
jgi:phosphatidylserine/phosphatidylglycerophosphate/cardiolipin synthase-like enzyme